MSAPRRKSDSPALATSPETEAVLIRYKREEPAVAIQLEHFFDLFRGIGAPMSFAPESLAALDEAFPSLQEQLKDEAENTDAEQEDLMLLIQLCGFYWGALIIELLGGQWVHDPDEGSMVTGVPGVDGSIEPFDPFIRKAQSAQYSLVKEFERVTGVKVKSLEDAE